MATERLPRVIIVGGGFGGLAAARALAKARVELLLVDRRNYHLFQPLLYQVATAALSPAEISAPIRRLLGKQANCQVMLGEVRAVDAANKRLEMDGGRLDYDYLILATGATHAYFGHDEWKPMAPGIKNIEDAIELRRRILLAFETAEYQTSPEERRATLTFAIVGGGPTGVELAGAIQEIAARSIPEDYKNIDTRTTRVMLFQGDARILPQFPPGLSRRAQADLEKMGVEVRVGARVTNITAEGISVGSEFIPVKNVFWAAGVRASSLGKTLGVALDKAGRVEVGPDLTPAGHPEIFIVGDFAAAKSGAEGKAVPGVAPAAIQMGRYAGRMITREAGGSKEARPPFVYVDKGSLAVIGKSKAVAQIGRLHIGGFLAWLLWGGVHIATLIGFHNRVRVMISWFWNWLVNARDARLITGMVHTAIPLPPDFAEEPAGDVVKDVVKETQGRRGE